MIIGNDERFAIESIIEQCCNQSSRAAHASATERIIELLTEAARPTTAQDWKERIEVIWDAHSYYEDRLDRYFMIKSDFVEAMNEFISAPVKTEGGIK